MATNRPATRPDETADPGKSPPGFQVQDLVVRLAASEEEVRAAQALRYRVFYEEMSATPSPEMAAQRLDFDRFDAAADHLLVIDSAQEELSRAVVGTYRLIRREATKQCGGFYSCSEFDIAKLREWPGEILELGRSCVEKGYRDRRVIDLLWMGIARYLNMHEIELMFGCGSLPGTDVERLKQPLSYLYHFHLAPRHIRPRAVPERYVSMNLLAKDAVDQRRGMAMVPPLIKGYLRLGGFVGDGAVIDKQFNCVDVCIVVKTDLITGKYAKRYGCEVENLDAA